MKFLLLSATSFFLILLVACTGEAPSTLSLTVISPTSASSSGYPAPASLGPYPGVGQTAEASGIPTAVPIDPATLPTPDPLLGSVEGVLNLEIDGEPQPVPNQILYLARVLTDTEGKESVASFSRTDSPRTVSGAQGEFKFINVEPGKYGLVIDTVTDSFLLGNPADGGNLLALVESGVEFDFGELVYTDLPLPQ
jgi:hypothetical protein